MKYTAVLAGLAMLLMPACCLAAQYRNPAPNQDGLNRGEIDVFGEYLRFTQVSPTINFVGVGGRVELNSSPHWGWGAQMSYAFAQSFTSSSGSGVNASLTSTSLHPLIGLFGPRFQLGTSGPFRFFVTGKAGFVDLASTSKSSNGSNFNNAVSTFGGSSTHIAGYPGAGIETFWGPVGFRLEVGDLIFPKNGINNDLRVTGGPAFRF